MTYVCIFKMSTIDILFHHITTLIKACVAFVFGPQNFYEHCDLTKKYV